MLPSTITLQQVGVVFVVFFFAGLGWTLAAWIVGRLLRGW